MGVTSVTHVHHAKAGGRNEMPFDRDIRVVSSNTVLDRGPRSPTGRGDFGVGIPCSQRCRLIPDYFGQCFYRTMRYVHCAVLLQSVRLSSVTLMYHGRMC